MILVCHFLLIDKHLLLLQRYLKMKVTNQFVHRVFGKSLQ